MENKGVKIQFNCSVPSVWNNQAPPCSRETKSKWCCI